MLTIILRRLSEDFAFILCCFCIGISGIAYSLVLDAYDKKKKKEKLNMRRKDWNRRVSLCKEKKKTDINIGKGVL